MLINKKIVYDNDNAIGYIESIFDSKNVLKTTYFPKTKKLYISFSRGKTYSYQNIDNELYNKFEEAQSQGLFFNENIKNKKEYPYYTEFSLIDSEMNEINKILKEYKENKNEDYD